MAKVIAVASGKGGTGKSTIAASLSFSLAKLGSRVIAVDLDCGLRSLDLLLGVEDRAVFDLCDAVRGGRSLSDTMIPCADKLALLCAPAAQAVPLTAPELLPLLRQAAACCDYLVLDMPAGVGLGVELARELAELTLLVVTPDLMAARDARSTADAILSGAGKPCRVVVNKVSRSSMLAGGFEDLDQLLDRVGAPLLAVVPEDGFINSTSASLKASLRRLPLTDRVLEAMARRLTGEEVSLLLESV